MVPVTEITSQELDVAKEQNPDGFHTEVLVCPGWEFIPLKVSKLNTQVSAKGAVQHGETLF